MTSAVVVRIRTTVQADFTDEAVAHDLGHLDRVARLAAQIAEAEGADPQLAQVIAYVHDYHRVVEPDAVWPCIEKALADAKVPEGWWPTVREAVAFTGRYRFAGNRLDNAPVLAQAVCDADKLDAIGAIGIARAFMFGGAIAEPMWNPEAERLAVYRSGRTSSVIAHFYEKLVWLGQDMVTETGRELGTGRARFLIEFLRRFHEEWGDADGAPLQSLQSLPSLTAPAKTARATAESTADPKG